ncbi:D-hexose-6-phosphate mutarotase [Psychromonas sp. SP041]|uniref:D-hexose-6-phosphate mutarotase n=1 Tax=Psychromonas sp. SP041 TaxID=1365007 RepID=UPI0004052DFA|nr:D-hexose-6-phosphate mutarotase [Psychromonas sp. SP041]
MISHLRLKTTKTLSPSICMQVDDNGFEFVVINHKNFDAAFSLHGAHLVHFQTKQQAPLIYLSKSTPYNHSKAIRGGVPICWPWFGNTEESKSKNLPSHGLARISQWTLANINETGVGVDIEFSLTANAETKAIWDHDFSLTLNASLSDQIELSLITNNTSNEDFSYGGALHTYLHVADSGHCSVEGLAPSYKDSLDNGKRKSSDQILNISESVDSIYDAGEQQIRVNDKSNQRTITINNEGNDSVVVWNPWVEIAKKFVDMPDDGYKTMLCIESAITSKQGVLIKAGQSHTLKTVIK